MSLLGKLRGDEQQPAHDWIIVTSMTLRDLFLTRWHATEGTHKDPSDLNPMLFAIKQTIHAELLHKTATRLYAEVPFTYRRWNHKWTRTISWSAELPQLLVDFCFNWQTGVFDVCTPKDASLDSYLHQPFTLHFKRSN